MRRHLLPRYFLPQVDPHMPHMMTISFFLNQVPSPSFSNASIGAAEACDTGHVTQILFLPTYQAKGALQGGVSQWGAEL